MTFAISEALDGQLGVLIGAIITLLGTLNLVFLKGIKKDTGQVNDAVNHKEEGEPTLKQQVDSLKLDMFEIKQAVKLSKKASYDLKSQVDKIDSIIVTMMSYIIRRDDAEDVKELFERRKDGQTKKDNI